MSAIREFRCVAHDFEFESTEEKPKCPNGCSASFVVQEFRTPPAIRHRSTSTADMLMNQLAKDYNMTDMRGDKDGSSVMHNTRASSGGAKVSAPEKQARWAPSLFKPDRGWAQRGDPEPVYTHNLPGKTTGLKPILASVPSLRQKTAYVKHKDQK